MPVGGSPPTASAPPGLLNAAVAVRAATRRHATAVTRQFRPEGAFETAAAEPRILVVHLYDPLTFVYDMRYSCRRYLGARSSSRGFIKNKGGNAYPSRPVSWGFEQ
jgi:hypothetical protein